MMRFISAVILAAACSSVGAVTPIEKVITLLKDLQAKVEKQGAKEAVQYDKYACFCKNQAEFKKNAIDKSEEKIKVLEADIKDLEGEIKSLNSDISDLGKDIKKLEEDIGKETEKRKKEKEEYDAKAKDLNEAIDACGEAIEALKDSKKQMKDAKVDLAQLKSAAFNVKTSQSPEAVKQALVFVKQAAQSAGVSKDHAEGAPKFEYQSNDIIATIEDLEATFKSNKRELDLAEHDAKAASEKKLLGFTNEKTFKTKEKKEKEVLVEDKTEEKTEAESSKDESEANKKSDEDFVKELTSSCEQKAKDWDQRSKARADEMTALAEATSTLENGALGAYSVNKKLVGLVKSKESLRAVQAPKAASPTAATVESGKKAAVKKTVKPASFLQMRSVENSQAAAVKRMIALLESTAGRLQSPVLSAVVLKAQLKEDHFSNVRALIKDLMAKLKADAKAEETTKNFCDKEMKKATDNRDKANLNIEEENGIIAKKTSLVAEKAKDIEDLSGDIAELNKDLLEAEELRKEEKADNAASVEEAKAGSKAVESALKVLEGFYKSALVQVAYKPPKSDRYGETVGDVAPEAFEGEYKGLGDSAKGILGILEVIKADFDRTEKTTEAEEKKAEEEHKKYVKKAEDSIKEKTKDKKDAESDKKDAESAIVQAKDDLYDAEKLRDSALSELDKLSSMCVEGEETYEERVAKRQEEIAALKEAMQILDDWQKD